MTPFPQAAKDSSKNEHLRLYQYKHALRLNFLMFHISSSIDAANKALGNEFRALNHIHNIGVNSIHLPLSAIVDFRGYR